MNKKHTFGVLSTAVGGFTVALTLTLGLTGAALANTVTPETSSTVISTVSGEAGALAQ